MTYKKLDILVHKYSTKYLLGVRMYAPKDKFKKL